VHNLYLQLLMELGPPGLMLAMSAIGICMLRLARVARRPISREMRIAAIALLGAFIAYLIMSFIDFDLTEMEIWVLLGVSACVPVRWALVVPAGAVPAQREQPALAPI
jgi:O-antigen ligase